MYNKILITGEPRSGKTSLLERVIAGFDKKKGFLSREVLDEDGDSKGFEMVTSDNSIVTLASTRIRTPFSVPTKSNRKASAYYIDVPMLDEVVASVEHFEPDDVLYLDQVGQMEMMSERFKELWKKYLESPNILFATISLKYVNQFVDSKNVHVFYLRPDNREAVEEYLDMAADVVKRRMNVVSRAS